MKKIKKKTLSSNQVFELLKSSLANQGILLITATVPHSGITIEYRNGVPMKVTDNLMMRACREGIYLPDRQIIDGHIRNIVNTLHEVDQEILRVACGIDQRLPANLSETIALLLSRKIYIREKNELPIAGEKRLRSKLYDLGTLLKNELKKVYKPSILSFSDDKISKVPASDIARRRSNTLKPYPIDKQRWEGMSVAERKSIF